MVEMYMFISSLSGKKIYVFFYKKKFWDNLKKFGLRNSVFLAEGFSSKFMHYRIFHHFVHHGGNSEILWDPNGGADETF